MGHAALDFKHTQEFTDRNSPSPDEEELSDLLKFCERPQSIGLSNVKESLRNVVLHMMALMGLETGYRYGPILDESFVGLSHDGAAENLRKKKKKRKLLWDQILQLDRMLAENFVKLFEHTRAVIYDVKKEINHKIQVLDAMIETNKDDGFFSKEELADAKTELENLQELKTEVEMLETNLEHTNNSLDVIEIEKQLNDQLQAFPKKTTHAARQSAFLASLKRTTQKNKNMSAFQITANDLAEHAPAESAHAHESQESHAQSHAETHSESHASSTAMAETSSTYGYDTTPSSVETDSHASDHSADFDAGSSAAGESSGGSDESGGGASADAEAADDFSHSESVDTAHASHHDAIGSDDQASDEEGDGGEEDEEDNLEPQISPF